MPLDIPPVANLWLPPKPAIIRPDRARRAMFPMPAFVPGGETDPYFSSVVALLHFNGANNSTTFTDSSPSPKTFVGSGGAKIDTSQSVFGGASLKLSAYGDWIEAASNPAFAFTGDYTWEFRIRFASVGGEQNIIGGTSGGSLDLYINGTTLYANAYGGGSTLMNTWSPSANTWYAVALTRGSNITRMFIDGVMLASTASISTSFAQAAFNIGDYQHGHPTIGWFDEVRITKGVCRYTANYTVRALPFPDA